MSSLKSELIGLCEIAANKFELPLVKQVYMPEPHPAPDKDSEFGIVALDDGSSGLYYAWMGEAQTGMNERFASQNFVGKSPLELVSYFRSEHEADRSLGLAAINAISQFVFRQAGYQLEKAGNSMGELDIRPDDHLGMVGYFPSLVRQLNEQNVRVTVIEKKAKFVESHSKIEVSLDPKKLGSCNKVLSTATILLNESIDEVLEYTQKAEVMVVVGPTAGFFPDPLFNRGVSAVGGAEIVNIELAISRLKNEEGLGDSAGKYIIRKNEYPGSAVFFG